MHQNHKVLIELVVVLALVVFGLWSLNKNPTSLLNYGSTPAISTEDMSQGSVNVGAPVSSISYQDALVKYKNARLQLDKDCQASSYSMTFKNGSSVMVDNRASVARMVKVGSTFSVKAYGFKIIKLYSEKLPATWYVDCDKSQNVSTILLQK